MTDEERVARAICYANCLAAHPGDIERATCQAEAGWDMWLAEARAAIAVTPEWQPIETAPKDGTEILAYSEHGCTGTMLARHIALCDFLTDSEIDEMAFQGASDETLETADWFAADFIQGERLSPDCHPTHWMPLPAPPSAAADVLGEG